MNRHNWTRRRVPDPSETGTELVKADADDPEKVSRRKIFRRAVLVTAVGAAGGATLTEVFATPASAAPAHHRRTGGGGPYRRLPD